MLSSLTTKLALRKVGLSSDALDFSKPADSSNKSAPGAEEETTASGWPAWMSTRKLPLTYQSWLAPVPPPVPVAECPKIGDLAPFDRDRQLNFGGGRKVIVLFLRCVGCAFAQKSFLALRALSTRNQGKVTCIAVSHSSKEATRKWVDILGGAWNVEIIVDEDRAIYAAWGLGLGSIWYMFNPTSQSQGWKEKGWLGEKVATSLQRVGAVDRANAAAKANAAAAGDDMSEGPSNMLGNKWQQAGLFAIDGRGTVVWAEKALRADDTMDVDSALKALGF